ncbi:hypothetical protein [Streptomyces sp. NPDC127033]|uniref:hypothetical protein n=1 Tax=Streptomyces sp. NPDC127033 TaxID=3347110 RepID=UPI003656C66F
MPTGDEKSKLPDEAVVPFYGEKGSYRAYEARMAEGERRQALEAESERLGVRPGVPVYVSQHPSAVKAAQGRLLAGTEFALDADDFSGRYTLRALPAPVPAYVLPRHAPRPGHRRHRKPRWFNRFRLHLRLPGSFPFRRRARKRHAAR